MQKLDSNRRAELGQFMTPSSVADFMASLFSNWSSDVRLLEPSAGVGSLVESFANEFFKHSKRGSTLNITCFEIEAILASTLATRAREIQKIGEAQGAKVHPEVLVRDFLLESSFGSSFSENRFTHVILNPPYKKIGANSEYRLLLRASGIESVNLYTAFLGLSVLLTARGGEIVAIVPRSFCNGLYFRPFRDWLLGQVSLDHIHVFESRNKAFKGDEVLQENIIIKLTRGVQRDTVTISSSNDASFTDHVERKVAFEEVVRPGDSERYIHIPLNGSQASSPYFQFSLSELGLAVSTGPVVDFRLRDYLTQQPAPDTVPLLYAHHFGATGLSWPREHKKPNAILVAPETMKWLLPRGSYTVVKRFSAKEERRRVVAYSLDASDLQFPYYGFENHLNIIHANKNGIDTNVARGLSIFLNSTVVDQFFRSFSGHTQVNATDLRQMKFPSIDTLTKLGEWSRTQRELSQEIIDAKLENFYGD